jgi:hypothetical protein
LGASPGSREPGLASRPGPSGFDPARNTFRQVWAALFSEGHKTLAFEFARAVGLEDFEDGWNLHYRGLCPVNGSIKIKAVQWAQGGIHSWGIACRADDFTDKQWTEITAFQIATREDYLASAMSTSGQDAERLEAKPASAGPKDDAQPQSAKD